MLTTSQSERAAKGAIQFGRIRNHRVQCSPIMRSANVADQAANANRSHLLSLSLGSSSDLGSTSERPSAYHGRISEAL